LGARGKIEQVVRSVPSAALVQKSSLQESTRRGAMRRSVSSTASATFLEPRRRSIERTDHASFMTKE
jgi:hypothetical protein